MASQVRVRFAPSPTGFLHVGGVRTALFNWLYARHWGGKFMLRIEDTDTERSEKRFTDDILACMRWLGLDWDEELVYQSSRMEHYRAIAEKWIEKGFAYRCTATEAELSALREEQTKAGLKPRYDGRYRESGISADCGKPFVIRAKLPHSGTVEFEDLIHGKITFQNSELDDFVLIRSNGAPTYNFTCVIDDVEMQMTHIIRGDDHINNTPKQVHLYRFFGYDLPKFAHLPMILGTDKKKLSKRHLDVSANAYRAEGYLPEALLNFMVRLGWSHGDQEVFTRDEMVRAFDFDHVQKSAAVFNPEKLLWVSGEHIKRADPKRLRSVVIEDYAELFSLAALEGLKSDLGLKLVTVLQPKVKLMKELASQLVPLVSPGVVALEDVSALKWNKNPDLKAPLKAAIAGALSELSGRAVGDAPLSEGGMGHAEVDQLLRSVCERTGVKLSDLTQPMRLALTGKLTSSAGLFDLVPLLPWSTVHARLKQVEGL
jgi:glutamyl-tRNA synthetase